MEKFFSFLFHDPILITASIVFVLTIAILAWALKIKDENEAFDESADENQQEDEMPVVQQTPASGMPENNSIIEAHLKEMTDQLSEINRRVAEIEKNFNKAPKATGQSMDLSNIEKLIERIEVKLNLMSSNSLSGQGVDISHLESKLEGIHKLLVFLTDAGNNSNQK